MSQWVVSCPRGVLRTSPDSTFRRPLIVIVFQYELSFKSAQLETAYEKTISQLASLVDKEAARKLRVDFLISETDNELLRLQCEQMNNDAVEFAQVQDSLNQQLLHANDEIKSLQSSLRMNNRAMQGIKVCYLFFPLSNCDVWILNCSQERLACQKPQIVRVRANFGRQPCPFQRDICFEARDQSSQKPEQLLSNSRV